MTAVQTIDESPTDATEVSLVITGMTCGACAGRIERKLNGLDGVRATVNYASERATVSMAPQVPVQTLLDEIESVGYSAEPILLSDPGTDQALETDQRARSIGRRLVVCAILFFPLCDLSIADSFLPVIRFPGWQWPLIVLAAPVITWGAWPFYAAAVRSARHLTSSMDTLVSLGILAATGWSLYAMFWQASLRSSQSGLYSVTHQTGVAVYLDVATGVTTFLLAGRYFEAASRRRTGNALRSLASVAAKNAALLDSTGTERRVPVSELAVGDRFVVRPGETIATDGEVLLGNSAIDLSSMTGESMPVEVAAGDRVIGGTVAIAGRLIVRATRIGAETQLAHMLQMVAEAQNEKASVQRLADRICSFFVPAVMLMSLGTLSIWILTGAPSEEAFRAALSVLIIACPCALGLATPTAMLVASGEAARVGIFFKGYQSLEASRSIDTVVLDKTGTVTEGLIDVVDVRTAPGVERSLLLRWAGALEQASEHLVARAVATKARAELGELPVTEQFVSLPGIGAEGTVEGHRIAIGRTSLFAHSETPLPPDLVSACAEWEAAGRTAVLVSCDGSVVGALALSDSVRPSAAPAVRELRDLGLRCVLVTGDNEATARSVGASIGVDDVIFGASPKEKVDVIRLLQQEGRSVAMVGDGVNDGPALAAANLGLAIGSGTDVAINAADLIVVRDDLRVVATAIRLARRTLRTIRGNLAWAFGYNVAAIPIAACGLLNPLIAAAAMALSSGFVVWNSSRLRHFHSDQSSQAS
ncbi:MAG: heavy metal translocating P-type ATPase [Acidimicrobiales bacterium]